LQQATCNAQHAARELYSLLTSHQKGELIMVSQRKRLANRSNARKSTGPHTARGKAIVSRNAVTHGLTTRFGPVLEGENEVDYIEFADAMRRDLRPVGVL
jgi:hypothetical protein